MTNTYYLLVEGTLVPGAKIEETKKKFAGLFKKDVSEIEPFFTGAPVILKRHIDYQTALHYQNMIKKAGLESVIKPAGISAKKNKGIGVLEKVQGKLDLKSSPINCAKLSAWEKGLNFNRPGADRVPFADIKMISVYQSESDEFRIVFMIKDHPRPYEIKASKVEYGQFEFENQISLAGSLITFIQFLFQKNSEIVIDKLTKTFLETKKAHCIEQDDVAYFSSLSNSLSAKKIADRFMPPDALAPFSPQPEPSVARYNAKSAVDTSKPTATDTGLSPSALENPPKQAGMGTAKIKSTPAKMQPPVQPTAAASAPTPVPALMQSSGSMPDTIPASNPGTLTANSDIVSTETETDSTTMVPAQSFMNAKGNRLAFPLYVKLTLITALLLLPAGIPVSMVSLICILPLYFVCYMWQDRRGEILIYAFFSGGSVLILVPVAFMVMGIYKIAFLLYLRAMGRTVVPA